MRTKEELEELSANIGKAIFAYHNAVTTNLKESGKEHKVENDRDGEDDEGLHLTIIGRHDDAIDIAIDKVRWNNDKNIVEVHICQEDFNGADYWWDISNLGDDADYVNDNIIW